MIRATIAKIIVGSMVAGASALAAQRSRPHPRRPDGDEHAHWLGIGSAVSFHGSAE